MNCVPDRGRVSYTGLLSISQTSALFRRFFVHPDTDFNASQSSFALREQHLRACEQECVMTTPPVTPADDRAMEILGEPAVNGDVRLIGAALKETATGNGWLAQPSTFLFDKEMRRCCGVRRKSEVQRTQKRGIRREGPPGGLNLGVGRGERPPEATGCVVEDVDRPRERRPRSSTRTDHGARHNGAGVVADTNHCHSRRHATVNTTKHMRLYIRCMYMSTKRVNFRLPEALVNQADIAAEVTHKNRTEVLIEALRQYLKELGSEDRFREAVVELYLDDQIEFEKLAEIIGRQDAEAVRSSKQVLDRSEGLADKLADL